MKNKFYRNKVVVITGVSSGIGKAIALDYLILDISKAISLIKKIVGTSWLDKFFYKAMAKEPNSPLK